MILGFVKFLCYDEDELFQLKRPLLLGGELFGWVLLFEYFGRRRRAAAHKQPPRRVFYVDTAI